jgi:endonuclease YncB( thermonuclease family)
MLRFLSALILAFAPVGPAWSQDSLAKEWTKAKAAQAKALNKTAYAGSEAAGKAKDATTAAAVKAKGQVKPAEFQATIIRVIDGDSLVVKKANRKALEIRLYGIDAPEWGQEGGAEATAALRPLRGRTVTIREMDTDAYSRTVALVGLEGESVNLRQAALGHAWHYARYCQEQPICGEIKKAEARAREMKRGLWAGEPIAPWIWRR